MGLLGNFRDDERGIAAIEVALVSALLTTALFNVVEVGRYAYVASQVSAASQAAAQAMLVTCSATETPVTSNCSAVASAITTALRGTTLGSGITQQGSLTERWYCVNSAGALQDMAAAASKPSNCSGAGGSGLPGLYVTVQATYTYQPIFPGLTIVAALPSTVTKTAWMRML
jgi:Flp pilus assembly protein TadG